MYDTQYREGRGVIAEHPASDPEGNESSSRPSKRHGAFIDDSTAGRIPFINMVGFFYAPSNGKVYEYFVHHS